MQKVTNSTKSTCRTCSNCTSLSRNLNPAAVYPAKTKCRRSGIFVPPSRKRLSKMDLRRSDRGIFTCRISRWLPTLSDAGFWMDKYPFRRREEYLNYQTQYVWELRWKAARAGIDRVIESWGRDVLAYSLIHVFAHEVLVKSRLEFKIDVRCDEVWNEGYEEREWSWSWTLL